jgi:ABC-2 type transport system permease protein
VSTEALAPAPGARRVQDPSAFGGADDWRRFMHLTWLIALTEFKLTYFGSALGYLWSLARPLMLFGVLYAVFSQIVRFGDGIESYPVVLLLNIVLFTFFSEATQASVQAVVNRENLVRKMHFPRIVIPLATVLTAAFNFGLNMIAVLAFVLAYGVQPRWSWLLVPLLVLPLVTFTAGVSMLLSALYVRFRDVSQIWAVVSTVLFYGSPVIYTIEVVPENVRPWLMLNPLASILEEGRHWVIDAQAPSPVDVIGGWGWFLAPIALFVLVCALGVWVFGREAPSIAERL